jgi:hypothetical protein
MRQAHPTSGAEPDAVCPISMDELGELYRADEYDLPLLLAAMPADLRARVAVFCYRKSHTHQLGLKIARACERDDLVRIAEDLGSVIYGQAHLEEPKTVAVTIAKVLAKPEPAPAPKKKISLGGSAAKGRSFD